MLLLKLTISGSNLAFFILPGECNSSRRGVLYSPPFLGKNMSTLKLSASMQKKVITRLEGEWHIDLRYDHQFDIAFDWIQCHLFDELISGCHLMFNTATCDSEVNARRTLELLQLFANIKPMTEDAEGLEQYKRDFQFDTDFGKMTVSASNLFLLYDHKDELSIPDELLAILDGMFADLVIRPKK